MIIYVLDRHIKNIPVVVARSVVRSAAVLLQRPRGLCVQQSSHVADHSVQSEMRESVRLHETQARVQVNIYVMPACTANIVYFSTLSPQTVLYGRFRVPVPGGHVRGDGRVGQQDHVPRATASEPAAAKLRRQPKGTHKTGRRRSRVVVVPRVLRYNFVPQGLPRSDQTPVPSTVISTSSSAASTPETERKPMAPPPQPPAVNARKDSQIRRPIPVRPPSVDNIPYQNNHSAVGKRARATTVCHGNVYTVARDR